MRAFERRPAIWFNWGDVISGGSYLSQSDLRIHFGLAGHSVVNEADVLWPDGRVEKLTNLAADQFYTVREGEGIVSTHSPEPPKGKLVPNQERVQ
jgi:hypothetical protein